jgi:chromate reductase
MVADARILLVSGSLRAGSTNTAVLRTARSVAPPEIETMLYEGLAALPHFNPDEDTAPLPPAVADLRKRIHWADALLFSTPEYAGALPGSFKNLLDWTVGDDRPGSIYEKPTAWINASPRGAPDAHHQLRGVLEYTKAGVVEAACVPLPVTGSMLDGDGLIIDPTLRRKIVETLVTLASAARGPAAGGTV